MEEDIKRHKFLEYGEYNGNLYGTHLDSIRGVIKEVSCKNLKEIIQFLIPRPTG